jgi:predicted NBD/HSP70 family sugar kinase
VNKFDLTNLQVATSGTARNINRRIILNLLRERKHVSRADLSRSTGLQRSTISQIVEQLIAERWVTEGAFGSLPRGRRPTLLHLNTERAGIIGIDIHPFTTTIALARLDTSFIAEASIPTRSSADEFIVLLCRRVTNLIKSHPRVRFEGIGVSLPGRVDPRSHEMIFAPNLLWRGLDLKKRLEDATGLPVEVENAANACALAEFWSGRHSEDVRNIIAVTVSEGVGVGLIVNGQLVRGPSGTAGEFGHVSLDENGPLCNCGNHGCWEVYASNTAASRHYRDLISVRSRKKNNGSMHSFADVLRHVRQGDARAGQALDQMAHYLGLGFAMLVSGFSPELIIVVGEVTKAWDRIEPIIADTVKHRCPKLKKPRILPTDPATQPRLRGAVWLVVQKHFTSPW